MIIFKNNGDWGTGIGVPLSSMQVDLNFWQLLLRIVNLEENPIQPNQIEMIEVIGNKMTIHMSDYTTFGPFTLPVAAFRFTGAFQGNHDYKTYDLLLANEGLYMVLHDFTSGPTFVNGSDFTGPWYSLLMPFPTKFSVGFSFPGKPGFGIQIDEYEASAMWSYRFDREVYFLADLPGTVGGLFIDATADMEMPIMKGLDQIGTITVAAGTGDAAFIFPDDIQFEINDVLRILRPVELDTTAKDLTVTFQGKLGTIPA
jgi:hypothetical protein